MIFNKSFKRKSMKASQVLIFLTLITFVFCKNTNSDETVEVDAIDQDSSMVADSNYVEIYVWVDKLRLREKADTRSEIIQELDEGEAILYLNEKSNHTEKINLRGEIFDEPWLKVKTSENNIGWVYGGAIRYEKPVFDLSPSPYNSCYISFAASKNYERLRSCREKVKAKQLKKDSRFITQTEDGYEVNLLSGKSRTLQNSSAEDENFRQYEYLYYIEKLGYFVFRVNFYEAGQFLLIDDKFGYSRPISGFPEPSPDYKHIAATNADASAGFEFNGIQLYGFTDHGMEVFFEKEFEFYEPFLPNWKDEKTVVIQLVPVDFAKNRKPTTITIQQNEKGKWEEL